ncbi:hypothetical protein VP01_3041g3 [Puccinia sorghi]|uniref:Reverse transcriptase domain-containing protein n=1 Tax=Puccinia sorghi TaxID=27349 RepID=A0A0L6V1S9_9BASI|nr:hypothetical protein VP01_3041g3 [Puccinia sorghi]
MRKVSYFLPLLNMRLQTNLSNRGSSPKHKLASVKRRLNIRDKTRGLYMNLRKPLTDGVITPPPYNVAWGTTYHPVIRKKGKRQGCPLSPLVFIIYFNDILDSATKGIQVPGLEHPTQGLLGVHLLSKACIVQTYLMSAGSYGGECVGMRKKQTRNMQGHSQSLHSLLIFLGLGVTPLSIHCTMQHLQLWHKGDDLKPILKDLIKHPVKSAGGKSWVANTKRNSTHLGRGADLLNRMAFKDCSINIYTQTVLSQQGIMKTLPQNKERWTMSYIKLDCDSGTRSSGKTFNFIATSIHIPAVNQGITFLSLLCMNALTTVKDHIRAIEHSAQNVNTHLQLGIFP